MTMQLFSQEILQHDFIPLSVDSHSTFHITLKEVRTSNARRRYSIFTLTVSYGEGVGEAHEGCVEPSTENVVCSHNMRDGSEPHLFTISGLF
jgi:hypothetical protein